MLVKIGDISAAIIFNCTGSVSRECNLSPRGGHTHTHAHTHRHTDFADKSNFKKPGAHRPQAGAPGLKSLLDT